MKVLCLASTFPTSPHYPSGTYVFDSVEAMTHLDYQYIVVVAKAWKPFSKNPLGKCRDFLNIKIVQCNYLSIPRNYFRVLSNWSLTWRIVKTILKVAKKEKIQLIHVHTELLAIPAIKAGKLLNLPVVVTIHGAETDKRYWRGVLQPVKKALLQADKIVLVGKPLLPFVEKIMGKSDCFSVVANGFKHIYSENDSYQQPWGIHLQFITVANLNDDGKGIIFALQALGQLKKMNIDDWSYTIVGDGVLRKMYNDLASTMGIEDKVRFVGACGPDKVYEFLKNAQVFILPSFREAFGIAFLEAMSCGLLAIGVKGQGPESFIVDGKTGFLVEPKNVQSIIDVLLRIFTDPYGMQQIALTGRKVVWADFSWQKHAQILDLVYKECLAKTFQ